MLIVIIRRIISLLNWSQSGNQFALLCLCTCLTIDNMHSIFIQPQQAAQVMQFRVRPSSKKSEQSQRSLVELPALRSGFQPGSQSQLRGVNIRLDSLESNFSNYQDLWRRERDIANAGYLEMQKRIDMLEYKTFSCEKDIRQVMQQSTEIKTSAKSEVQADSYKGASQTDFMSLRTALSQERDAHREYAKHQAELFEQMSRKQMRMESQIRELLNKQREDYDSRFSDQLEEIKNNENLKQKKLENQYELIKTVISNTEKKIFAEFERKLRNETVIKDFIEDKISELREEIAAEHKVMMSKEGKFVREMKQAMESIFSIIKNTQKELSEELEQTQKLSANNLKKLSLNLQMIKQKTGEELAAIRKQNEEIQGQLTEMKNFVNSKLEQNREMLLELEEDNGSRISSSRRNNQQHQGQYPAEVSSQKLTSLQKQFNSWKTITEQKNLNVFKQISNTLKTMKLQWKKENDEISSEVQSFKQSLANVKKSVPIEIKKSVQTMVTIFNNEFDTLAQELDTITDMVALSKKQVEKGFKQQLKKSEQDTLKQVKELIKAANKDAAVLMEKNSNKQQQTLRLYLEQEVKFVKDLLLQKNASLEAEMSQISQSNKKNVLNTTAQLEDFTLKLKAFNQSFKDHIEEQRKDDMKHRIELQQAMRKNANNLMDLYYKKCEFLVEGMKKAIEMNILKDMATMKRDIEALKEDQNKHVFQTRQQILNEVNQKLDRLAQERQSSQQIMHEAFDNQINTLRKSMSNEIGNNKLQMGEKINELVETLNELQLKGSTSTDELESTVQSLKESMWKMEAMSFSEQAKNKAIMDRLGEDINELSFNMTVLCNQLKAQ